MLNPLFCQCRILPLSSGALVAPLLSARAIRGLFGRVVAATVLLVAASGLAVVSQSRAWASLEEADKHSRKLTLNVPILHEQPEAERFYFELLANALEAEGVALTIVPHRLPQARVRHLLDRGELSLFWMLQTQARDRRLLSVPVGLTEGLIGQRILLIRPKDQPLFNQVSTVKDFARLKLQAGLGTGWFDVAVWKANGLPYGTQAGDWRSIYRMIPRQRRFDYIPRGMNEVLGDASRYPSLVVEQRLLLQYDRDFRFYLSTSGPNAGAPHYPLLLKALTRMRDSGRLAELVKQYWQPTLDVVQPENRLRLLLDTPR